MNFVLRVVSGPEGLGEKMTFGSDRPFVVGREQGSDAVFSADFLLSSTHFSVISNSQDVFLTDLASTNGTFLNGERVSRAQVFPGDQIRAGGTIFEVVHEAREDVPNFNQSVDAVEPLTITANDGSTRVIRFGNQLTIGRTEMALWTFPNDVKMSSLHFSIDSQGKNWELRDLNSSNGTFLNHKRLVSASPLQSGDSIVAGETRFNISILSEIRRQPKEAVKDADAGVIEPKPLLDKNAASESIRETTDWFATPSIKTLVDKPDAVKPVVDIWIKSPADERSIRFQITLHCLSDPSLTADYDQGQEITIGREPHNDLAFPLDSLISAMHARLRVLNHQVVLQDLESTNGTLINGTRIREEVLRHGGRFTIGEQRFKIGFVGQALDQELTESPAISKPEAHSDNPSAHISDAGGQTKSPPLKSPPRLLIGPDCVLPLVDLEIPFESFQCGSGLMLFGGCIPSFDPVDIARRLAIATPGWLMQSKATQESTMPIASDHRKGEKELSMELLSTTDPSWMIPWSQQWGSQKTLIVYSRSEPQKIKQAVATLCESLGTAPDIIPPHAEMFEFLANRLSDTISRIFSPLDAVLIELYAGKQWAYLAPKDMEATLIQLRFRKKHRW